MKPSYSGLPIRNDAADSFCRLLLQTEGALVPYGVKAILGLEHNRRQRLGSTGIRVVQGRGRPIMDLKPQESYQVQLGVV
jgi:hypothetical protein